MNEFKHLSNIAETEKAYIAGLFDGEGSMFLGKYHRVLKNAKPRTGRQLGLRIANNDLSVLQWLQSLYGGSLLTKIGPRQRGNQWQAQCQIGLHFLRDIQPYVKIKKRQVELAIQYQFSVKPVGKALSPKRNIWVEQAAAEISRLNNE